MIIVYRLKKAVSKQKEEQKRKGISRKKERRVRGSAGNENKANYYLHLGTGPKEPTLEYNNYPALIKRNRFKSHLLTFK